MIEFRRLAPVVLAALLVAACSASPSSSGDTPRPGPAPGTLGAHIDGSVQATFGAYGR